MAQQPSSTTSEAVSEGQARFREDSPPSSCAVLELSSIAPRAASGIADFAFPRMAPGIGGFNIDSPTPGAFPVEDDVAILRMRRRSLPRPKPKLIPLPPIQVERKAVIVGKNESSF